MQIIFPVGRLVGGSLTKLFPRTDSFGKPKLNKDGTPSMQCNFGFAIRKGAEQHWNQTSWGAQIWGTGKAAYPAEHVSPAFAWKVTDGDSQIPNKKGKKPYENENYRGHWILWFSQSWMPKTCNADGSVEISAEQIKIGYFVRVMADASGNNPSPSPGVYLNPQAVALIAEGEEIASEVDTSGFKAAPSEALPPGARPVTSVVPAFAAPVPFAAPPAPQVATPATPVMPNPAFLQVPPQMPLTPPKPIRQMTALAGGTTYEQAIAMGWTDATLIQHGMMTA